MILFHACYLLASGTIFPLMQRPRNWDELIVNNTVRQEPSTELSAERPLSIEQQEDTEASSSRNGLSDSYGLLKESEVDKIRNKEEKGPICQNPGIYLVVRDQETGELYSNPLRESGYFTAQQFHGGSYTDNRDVNASTSSCLRSVSFDHAKEDIAYCQIRPVTANADQVQGKGFSGLLYDVFKESTPIKEQLLVDADTVRVPWYWRFWNDVKNTFRMPFFGPYDQENVRDESEISSHEKESSLEQEDVSVSDEEEKQVRQKRDLIH